MLFDPFVSLLASSLTVIPVCPRTNLKVKTFKVYCSFRKIIITSKSEEFLCFKDRRLDRLSVRISLGLKFDG